MMEEREDGTMQSGRWATSPRLIFFGGNVFYQTIHTAGMKEKGEGNKRGEKFFAPTVGTGVHSSYHHATAVRQYSPRSRRMSTFTT